MYRLRGSRGRPTTTRRLGWPSSQFLHEITPKSSQGSPFLKCQSSHTWEFHINRSSYQIEGQCCICERFFSYVREVHRYPVHLRRWAGGCCGIVGSPGICLGSLSGKEASSFAYLPTAESELSLTQFNCGIRGLLVTVTFRSEHLYAVPSRTWRGADLSEDQLLPAVLSPASLISNHHKVNRSALEVVKLYISPHLVVL